MKNIILLFLSIVSVILIHSYNLEAGDVIGDFDKDGLKDRMTVERNREMSYEDSLFVDVVVEFGNAVVFDFTVGFDNGNSWGVLSLPGMLNSELFEDLRGKLSSLLFGRIENELDSSLLWFLDVAESQSINDSRDIVRQFNFKKRWSDLLLDSGCQAVFPTSYGVVLKQSDPRLQGIASKLKLDESNTYCIAWCLSGMHSWDSFELGNNDDCLHSECCLEMSNGDQVCCTPQGVFEIAGDQYCWLFQSDARLNGFGSKRIWPTIASIYHDGEWIVVIQQLYVGLEYRVYLISQNGGAGFELNLCHYVDDTSTIVNIAMEEAGVLGIQTNDGCREIKMEDVLKKLH